DALPSIVARALSRGCSYPCFALHKEWAARDRREIAPVGIRCSAAMSAPGLRTCQSGLNAVSHKLEVSMNDKVDRAKEIIKTMLSPEHRAMMENPEQGSRFGSE